MLSSKQKAVNERAEFERAVEDAAPDLSRYRAAQLHLAKLSPGTRAFDIERGFVQELYERIDSRARRIELPDREVTGTELIEFAQARALQAGGVVPIGGRGDARRLAERYQRSITTSANAQRLFNEAEATLIAAKRAEQAALEAYQAHGASRLVK